MLFLNFSILQKAKSRSAHQFQGYKKDGSPHKRIKTSFILLHRISSNGQINPTKRLIDLYEDAIEDGSAPGDDPKKIAS